MQAHRLLGGALMALHSHPLLTPADLADAAPYSDIAHQVESVRISWQPLDDKDIYSLWSVFQAPYRISAAFELRVVLIDSTVAASAPLPVLRRGADGSGPEVAASLSYPGPEITAAAPPGGQPTALPGEEVQVLGVGLAEVVAVRFSHPVLPVPLTFPPDEVGGSQVTFTVPADAPAGFGTVALSIRTAGPGDWFTNESPLGIGPQITSRLPATVAAAQHSARLAVTCLLLVRAGQNAALLIGGTAVPALPITATTSDLAFTVGPLPDGTYSLRLRVDGADTRLIDQTTTPPSYIRDQSVTVTP